MSRPSSIRLAVLGMLKLRPMTGYEIKQAYQKGPANFMPVSFGQIYPALARLRQEKMVRQEKQQSGRGNIRYFITSKGEEAFREWLFSAGDSANHKSGSCTRHGRSVGMRREIGSSTGPSATPALATEPGSLNQLINTVDHPLRRDLRL